MESGGEEHKGSAMVADLLVCKRERECVYERERDRERERRV